MYLISVYFDEKANKELRRYINMIAEATGNTFMTDNNVPPHMTISSVEARNADVLMPAFDKVKDEITSGDIQFVSVGQLLPYVMYVTPVLNEYLQKMQEKIYDGIKDIPDTSVSRFYKPYSWLPHVTIGKKINGEQMKNAFEIMQKHFSPFDAKVTEIGLAKVNPHKDVKRYIL